MSHEDLARDPEDLARARSFLDHGSAGQGPQNLSSDRYDRRTFSELVDASPDAGRLLAGASPPDRARPLLLDLYLAYYAAQPDIAPEHEVERRPRLVNRPFLLRMLEDKSFYDARLVTRLDEAASFLAALSAAERLLLEIGKLPQPPAAPEGRGADGGGPGPRGDADEHTIPGRALRRAAREAAEGAEGAAEQYAGALSSWGLEPSDLERVPLSDRLELVGRLKGEGLKNLAELAGRMRELARLRARASATGRADEVHSVTLGGDLSRALPAELACLASEDPYRSADFFRRLADGEVLSYEMAPDDDLGEGPVVLAIDCSYSMSYRGKMDWAVAVALAVVDLCSGRGGLPKRHASVLFFNTKVVHEVAFAPGERDPEKLLSVATVGPSGGTDYGPALRRAADEVEASEGGSADVLFVTDELCRLEDGEANRLLARKRDLGFSIHAVLIGVAGDARGDELLRYSDTVHPVAGLIGRPGDDAAEDAAGEVFGRFL